MENGFLRSWAISHSSFECKFSEENISKSKRRETNVPILQSYNTNYNLSKYVFKGISLINLKIYV